MDRIKEVIESNFPLSVTENDGKFSCSFGALKRFDVWIADKKLCVDTESNTEASEEEVMETNKRFRKFLDQATGYTSKQRAQAAKKEVQ